MSFETVASTIKNSNNHVRKSPKAIFNVQSFFFKKIKIKNFALKKKLQKIRIILKNSLGT